MVHSLHCLAAALWQISMGRAPEQLRLCPDFLGLGDSERDMDITEDMKKRGGG